MRANDQLATLVHALDTACLQCCPHLGIVCAAECGCDVGGLCASLTHTALVGSSLDACAALVRTDADNAHRHGQREQRRKRGGDGEGRWKTAYDGTAKGVDTYGKCRDRRWWRGLGQDPDPEPINPAILSAFRVFLSVRSLPLTAR